MREVTQNKFDKAQKLIRKGYTPTAACKEVKLNYMRYKELLEISDLPKLEEYKKREDDFLNIQESMVNIEAEIPRLHKKIQELSNENYKLKQFIKEFL